MAIKSLDDRITPDDFFRSLAGKFRSLLASTMSPEEKLAAIKRTTTLEVQKKRELAREVGAQMRAIADPDTATLEPLEAAKARRAKLVALGAEHVNDTDQTRLGQISQEIKSVDALIANMQATYDMLTESYNLALSNYKNAFAALETIRTSGPAMIAAIRTHQQALATRDRANAQSAEQIDTKFMDDLAAELATNQAELRSDKALDSDLDATQKVSIDGELAKLDAQTVDADLMAEFQAAADKKKK